MSKVFSWLVFFRIFMTVVFTFVFIYLIANLPSGKDRLCGVAEISPDITPQEREYCRMARRHKL